MSFPNSNWANEAGEPYMTAAELRFEAELDAQSAEERYLDDDGSRYDYDDDLCEECGEGEGEHDRSCSENEDYDNSDEFEIAEDAAMEAGLFGWDA